MRLLRLKPFILYFCLAMYIAYAMYQTHFRVETEFTDFFVRIMNFEGQAPDQYRILPYLILKGIYFCCTEIYPIAAITSLISDAPILRSIFIFNLLFSFLLLPLLDLLLNQFPEKRRYSILILFALLYPVAHFSGERPISQLVMCLTALLAIIWRDKEITGKSSLFSVIIVMLAFSRADVALFFALFLMLTVATPMVIKVLWVLIPIAVQLWLQFFVFPDATYFTPVLAINFNFSPHALKYGNHYLLLGFVIVYYKQTKDFFAYLWYHQRHFIYVFIGYFLLLLIIARIYEYRLYLPFVPFLFLFMNDFITQYNKQKE